MSPRNQVASIPVIDQRRCSGCGRCVAACPQQIITLETAGYRKHAVVAQPDRCSCCGICVAACPLKTIAIQLFSP